MRRTPYSCSARVRRLCHTCWLGALDSIV
jgi:hypothetical protein